MTESSPQVTKNLGELVIGQVALPRHLEFPAFAVDFDRPLDAVERNSNQPPTGPRNPVGIAQWRRQAPLATAVELMARSASTAK